MHHEIIIMTTIAALSASPLTAEAQRSIANVQQVEVSCPEGTAPRLPDRVWVSYSDGYAEFRQVRWANSPLADEQLEAEAKAHPARSQYTVSGHIVGDESTAQGYAITAKVFVVSGSYSVPKTEVAHPFSIKDVTLDGDNRLTHNRDEAIAAICSWDVAQQLYNYRDT